MDRSVSPVYVYDVELVSVFESVVRTVRSSRFRSAVYVLCRIADIDAISDTSQYIPYVLRSQSSRYPDVSSPHHPAVYNAHIHTINE